MSYLSRYLTPLGQQRVLDRARARMASLSPQQREKIRSRIQYRSASPRPRVRSGAFEDVTGKCHYSNGKYAPNAACSPSSKDKFAFAKQYLRSRYGSFEDVNGRCHYSNGKYAPDAACSPSSRDGLAFTRSLSPRQRAAVTMDANGKCHNKLGRYTSCGLFSANAKRSKSPRARYGTVHMDRLGRLHYANGKFAPKYQ